MADPVLRGELTFMVLLVLLYPAWSATAQEGYGPVWIAFDTVFDGFGEVRLTFEFDQRTVIHLFTRNVHGWLGMTSTSTSVSPAQAALGIAGARISLDPVDADGSSDGSIPMGAGASRTLLVFERGVRDVQLEVTSGTLVELGRGQNVRVYDATDFDAPGARAEVLSDRLHALAPGAVREELGPHTFGFLGSAFPGERTMLTSFDGPSGHVECPCVFMGSATSPSYTTGAHEFKAAGAAAGIVPKGILVLVDPGAIE